MNFKRLPAVLGAVLLLSGHGWPQPAKFPVTQTWYGVLAPAGTPGDIVNALNAVIVKAVQKEDLRARLAQMGADPIAETPEHFSKLLKEEIDRWATVVRESKAKSE